MPKYITLKVNAETVSINYNHIESISICPTLTAGVNKFIITTTSKAVYTGTCETGHTAHLALLKELTS